MGDDKEVLIIESSLDDLELELNSESPYCSTTTPNFTTFENPPNSNSRGRHQHAFEIHHNKYRHNKIGLPSSSSIKSKGFSIFGVGVGGKGSRLSQQGISTISSNLLNTANPNNSSPAQNSNRIQNNDIENGNEGDIKGKSSQQGQQVQTQIQNQNHQDRNQHRNTSNFTPIPTSSKKNYNLYGWPSFLRRRFGFVGGRFGRYKRLLRETWRFHWRMVLSSSLTVISSAGCLISFPLHLEAVTKDEGSDGFSACFAIASILVILFLLSSLGVKLVYWSSARKDDYEEVVTVIKPIISWKNIAKIGFSVGLSVLSICSAWEDHKVLCNFQDPFLGLVIIFAIITHAVSKWRHLGLKRAFALLAVAGGVFVSVDYMLVDEHRCRGYYYAHPPKDIWTWKVHLVWTLAFVVAVWLWTVAMFCLESAIPYPQAKSLRGQGDECTAVKMSVLRVKANDGESMLQQQDNQNNPNQSVIESLTSLSPSSRNNAEEAEPDLFSNLNPNSHSQSQRSHLYHNPYSKVSYISVFNSVFWFHISTWIFITSLFWTEFIPGFGIGKGTASSFPSLVWTSFYKCFHDGCSWWLIISLFVYSQSFTYLIFLIRSSLLAICISCLGFPIIGLWWSFFRISTNVFVWMPVYSGELFCSILGIPLIFGGTLYMFKLDILNPNRIAVSL